MKKFKYMVLFLACIVIPGTAQKNMPRELPREYTSPAELCSINSQLDFPAALSILSEYSINFANKPIFDPTKQTGPIGVDIDAMQWEKALQIMLSTRGLWYNEKEHFLEIVYPSNTTSGSGDDNADINVGPDSREIKIETIFFEGNRSAISEIGIDWSTFYNGKVNVSGDQLGALSLSESFLDVSVTVPSSTYDVDVRALLSVFDSKNIGKVLAQPQVIVTEGNQGEIQVGEDFSIKTKDFAGNIIDRFFSTGTIMEVTPYIIKDSKKGQAIVLKIHVERSQAQPNEVSTIIYKSQANSYIQLYDGEETIIAGLYNTEKASLRKGLPFIKDLPPWLFGLSYIFGYNREEITQKELIIIIKATILPSVFDRKNMPVDDSIWDEDAELKLRPYQRKYQEPELPTREVKSNSVYSPVSSPKSIESNRSNRSNRIVQQPRNAPVVEQRPAYAEKRTREPEPFKISTKQSTSNTPAYTKTKRIAQKPQAAPVLSATLPASKAITKVPEKDYFLGNVEKVDDDIILIKWRQDFNTDRLHGKRFTVIRVNGDNKPFSVGYVLIQSTKYERSIGRRLEGQVRPGDMIVVKFDNNV